MIKYIFVIAIICCSCQEPKSSQNKVIEFHQFPKETTLELHNFIEYQGGVLSRMFLRDTMLIVYNWRGKGGYFFYEYGLNSKLNIGKYFPLGRGPGKALGSLSAGLYKNNLWMYDISLNKIILTDLTTKSQQTNTYKEYPFPEKYYNIQFITDSKLLANGNYEMSDTFQEIDLNLHKVTASYGVLLDTSKNIPFYAWKRANEGLLSLKPTSDKAATAHMWSDKIEILDLKTKQGVTIKGPENFNPEFVSFKSDTNQDLIGRNEKSRNAFSCLTTTDKYIYALFSGNNMTSPYINYGKTIFIYDWSGKPVREIKLDRYISSFVVSKDDRTVYAYDVSSKFIMKANL